MTEAKAWVGLIGLCLASFLGCIDFTIVNTALPAIQTSLNAGIAELQWIINIFMLTLSALMVVKGRLADIYGRRRLLYIGITIFAIASLGAGLSPTIEWLIFFRLIQGIGVAILYTVPIAIIPSLFSTDKRGKATGILIGVNGLGLAIGPVIGGFIVSALSWRWIFFVNLPVIMLSILFCLNAIPESKNLDQGAKIDWLGLALLIIGSPLLVLATVQGSSWGWTSVTTLGTYAIALISLLAFYVVERRNDSPIIQFELFKGRVFLAAITANFSLAFFYTVLFFLLPLYLHNVRGQSSDQIGLTLLPATLMVALLSPLVGNILDKRGPKLILLIGFALLAVSAILQLSFDANSSIGFIIATLVLFGIGWGCILSPSIVAALSSVPETVGGVAMGSLGTLHNFGGAIGLALGTVVYNVLAKNNLLAHLAAQHIASGMWVAPIISNPDTAVQNLQATIGIDRMNAEQLVNQFFIHGYHGAMGLLLVMTVVVFLIVAFSFPNKKLAHPVQSVDPTQIL